jgi:steroid-22-oyl-CoA synthetase
VPALVQRSGAHGMYPDTEEVLAVVSSISQDLANGIRSNSVARSSRSSTVSSVHRCGRARQAAGPAPVFPGARAPFFGARERLSFAAGSGVCIFRAVPSIAELFLARSEDDRTGLRFEEASWTWREIVLESRARGGMLDVLHGPGPFHVGALLENVPEFLFLLGGAALVGATVVGINPTRRGAELAADVRHTDCQLVVTSMDQLGLLEGLDIGVPEGHVLVEGSNAYEAVLAEGKGWQGPSEVPRGRTPYLLLFTSGSTGAPKAVRVGQGRLAAAGSTMAEGSGFTPDDVLYCPMPMFHGNALFACVVPAIAAGATLVLRRRFSASGFVADVDRYGVTYFSYVGRALAHILATPASPADARSTLRLGFGTDASPMDITAFEKRFGCKIVEGYGSSEGAISMSRVEGTPRNALGKPPPNSDVIIADPQTGRECPRAQFDAAGRLLNASDAIGEIVSRDGVSRFEGYYDNPDADAERTRGGWFWSGDLGYRDERGYFYFAGRPADWLRVDGENFAAAPVERILARFPGVLTAAVYPVADPRTGDQVMTALHLVPGVDFDPTAFGAFLDAQPDLGTKWAPRFVRVVDHMPLTGTGKLDKRPLRSERWTTSDPVWWRPSERRGEPSRGAYRRLSVEDVAQLRSEFEANGRAALLDLPA